MTKKLFLLLMLIFSIVVTQTSVYADEQYTIDYVVNAIKNKVEMNWIRPTQKPSISAVVSFDVNEDGTVSPVSVVRSSGDAVFDDSIIKSVYKSIPFEYSAVIQQPISIEIFFSPCLMVANKIQNDPFNNNLINVSNNSNSNVIDFSEYLTDLQTKINSNWTPKPFAKKRENITSIKIDRDGALSNPSILEPSHDINFDGSTLEAIAKSVPMDAFPPNITAPTTNVQLTFHCKKAKENGKKVLNHYITASVLNVEGYDKYTDLVEQVLKKNLQDKNTIFEKRLVFEAQINSIGKLKYVKILEPSSSKLFNKSVRKILENSSFPQFPETINSDSITLKYELITGVLTGTRIFPRPE